MRALVTGATGFIGRRLLTRLDRPIVLSRRAALARRMLASFDVTAFDWNPEREPAPAAALDDVDALFHLAGESVASGRWTAAKKARIRDSRVLGTRNLVDGLRNCPARPRVLVSASAVGWYGSRGAEELDEHSRPGSDFLAQVCADWEREAIVARELGVRVVSVRFGIVLGRGGALAKMLMPFQLGLGSPLASGEQYMPWIHLDDLVELLLFAATNDHIDEPLNGTAPNPVTNREFTRALGRVLGRPTFMPAVPAVVLKTMVGEFAEVLIGSQRAVPRAALEHGFVFHHPTLEPALADILKK